MANETAQKLIGIGVASPTALVIQKQISASTGNVAELIRAAITPNVAKLLAPMITAKSINGPKLVLARMPAPVVNVLMEIINTPPVNTVAPVLSGTPTVGQTLTVTNGTWTSSALPLLYNYRWFRGDVPVGVNAQIYSPVEADVGALITCQVEAVSANGSARATSNALGPVIAA